MPEAADEVVVDQPRRLHQSVADRRTDERKATLLEILADRIGEWGAGRDLTQASPGVPDRVTVNELPDVGVEAAELLLNHQEGPSILDRRGDLETVPHDAGVGQERFDAGLVE